MWPVKGYVLQDHSDSDPLAAERQECALVLLIPVSTCSPQCQGSANFNPRRVNVKLFHQLGS